MLKIEPNKPFQATWDMSNNRLNPDNGLLYNIIDKIKNFLFYLPISLIAACVNPRSESEFHPSSYEGYFNKKIITPDQVHLSAHIRLAHGANPQTPTVILFNPLGASSSIHDELQAKLVERRCNVVTFDYRGLGTTWRPEDLVVDGESVFQYVTQELGTTINKVHFYGFSLGGAIAAQVKALHPESTGKYAGDRPFSSVFSLLTENFCIECLGWLVKKITSFVFSIFIAYPVYLLGWEWDGVKALSRLTGDKRIIYHPNDSLVPVEASLASKCPLQQRIGLDPKETGFSTHFAPIGAHLTDSQQNASTVVADFLAN